MQPVWALIVVVLGFLVIQYLRGRKRQVPEPKVYARRIDGYQITAYLHPHMGAACLADHGVQFGAGFRRKEGPTLPHDDRCRCRAVHFSYTSTEVFHGALRQGMAPETSIPGLPEGDALALLDAMRGRDERPAPESVESFLAEIGLERFSETFRAPVETFLRERYAFLIAQQAPQAMPPA